MNKLTTVQQVFKSYPEIVAVYLFGSYSEDIDLARDIDLAVLTTDVVNTPVNLYMELYPHLADVFTPLDVDLVFLKNTSLKLSFDIVSQGKVVYSSNDDLRTDYEYFISGRYMDFSYHLENGYRELYETFRGELDV